jgi:hypothetical protein
MPHELTHLLFHQLIASGIAPTWFDEGLAVYNQKFHEMEMAIRFKTALNDHNLLPLNTIDQNFPADADKAYLAYAQSWQLVGYMYQTFGLQKMAALIHDMDNRNQGFDADMLQALGLNVAHLENQWHLSLNQPPTLSKDQMALPIPAPPPPPNPYNSTTVALLLLGVALVAVALLGLGGIVTYQRRARRMLILDQQIQSAPRRIFLGQSEPPNWSHQMAYRPPSNYTSPSMYASPGQPPVPGQHIQSSKSPQFPSYPPS